MSATPDGSEEHGSAGTFLLGVGCQKGGTAWMHRYLESSPQCDPGFRKEYHVWDGLDLASGGPVRGRVAQQARKAARALEAGEAADGDALRRALFYADPEAYFDYFEALLRRSPQTRLTADITPSYADLSPERLAFVRDGFARRDVRVVVVYLMRDPVERVWSAVRMDRQRAGAALGEAEAYVPVAATRPMYVDRTRYDRTIARLDGVFGPDRVYYGFYERLFDASTLRPLCDFLGLDYVEPDLERHVNVSPKSEAALPEETVREVAGRFHEVYAAVAARFPEVDLAELWPSSRLL